MSKPSFGQTKIINGKEYVYKQDSRGGNYGSWHVNSPNASPYSAIENHDQRYNAMGDINTIPDGMNDQDKIDSLLPSGEYTDHYYESTERKHFTKGQPGSQFTQVHNLEDLLQHTLDTREGGLDGNDKDKFIAMGCNPAAFRDSYRYLMVEVEGETGNIDSTQVDDDQELIPVQKVRSKDGFESSEYRLAMKAESKKKTSIATLLILNDVDEENLGEDFYSEAKDYDNVLITAYPGTPGNFRGGVREENGKDWLENKIARGEKITVGDVKRNCFDGNDFGINLQIDI